MYVPEDWDVVVPWIVKIELRASQFEVMPGGNPEIYEGVICVLEKFEI